MTRARRVLAAAMISRTVSVLPAFLIGGLAVLMRNELDFTEAQLGMGISLYYSAYALSAVPAGRIADRLGYRRSIGLAIFISTICLLGIGLAQQWTHIAAMVAFAGTANAFSQPGTNVALHLAIRPQRQGLAFGMKQSAVPLASLTAGASVPLLGLTVGWRWAFLLAAAAAMAYFVVMPKMSAQERESAAAVRAGLDDAPRPRRDGVPSSRALLMIATAAGFASAAVNCLSPFFVDSAVARGASPALAGVMLSIGGAVGFASRIAWGWVADRRGRGSLQLTILLLGTGTLGLALLSVASELPILAVAVLLAFAAGSGWSGLLHFAVVRSYPTSPAAATGTTITGLAVGGMVGPLVFGWLATSATYGAAWIFTAGLMGLSAVLLAIARTRLIKEKTGTCQAG